MHIECSNIGKKYGRTWIFRGISASLESNNIYGIVGINGSGKSTLLQILSGFVTPNEGQISYDAGQTSIDSVFQKLSISAPYLDLPSELTVEECIENQAQFKPFKAGFSSSALIEEIQLQKHRNKTLDQLSSGMRQRLKLGLAIFADSRLLLVDEPCANLDAKWSEWFETCLRSESADRLVVISSNSQENELRLVNQPLINVGGHP
jgi:ABC-type multidrug transport system ATPase subunit